MTTTTKNKKKHQLTQPKIYWLKDAFYFKKKLLQAFCVYMLLVSFAYFLFLYIDIRLHVARIKYKGKVQSKSQQQQVTDNEASLEQVSTQLLSN